MTLYAHAGSNQDANIGDVVQLDGSESIVTGGTATYRWRASDDSPFLTFSDPTALDTTVTTRRAGLYRLTLDVSTVEAPSVIASDEVWVSFSAPARRVVRGGGIIDGVSVRIRTKPARTFTTPDDVLPDDPPVEPVTRAVPAAGTVRAITIQDRTATWNTADQQAAVDAAKLDGANTVVLTPTWVMTSTTSNTVSRDGSTTATDETLFALWDYIAAAGMRVVLKPHVAPASGGSRATLAPTDIAAWFTSYTSMLDAYLAGAETRQVAIFCVGSGFNSLEASTYNTRWTDLIDHCRASCLSPMMYSIDGSSRATSVAWWSDVDVAGISVSDAVRVSGEAVELGLMMSKWSTIQGRAAAIGKPVLYTSVGYLAVEGTTLNPGQNNTNTGQSTSLGETEQATAFEAVLTVHEGLLAWPWLGLAFREYKSNVGATDYWSPYGRPARTVLRAHWPSDPLPTTPAQVLTTSLPSAPEDVAYSYTLSGEGEEPLSWSASGLPAGLSINSSTGVISGTPTTPGTSSVTITVTGDDEDDDEVILPLVVTASSISGGMTPGPLRDFWVTKGPPVDRSRVLFPVGAATGNDDRKNAGPAPMVLRNALDDALSLYSQFAAQRGTNWPDTQVMPMFHYTIPLSFGGGAGSDAAYFATYGVMTSSKLLASQSPTWRGAWNIRSACVMAEVACGVLDSAYSTTFTNLENRILTHDSGRTVRPIVRLGHESSGAWYLHWWGVDTNLIGNTELLRRINEYTAQGKTSTAAMLTTLRETGDRGPVYKAAFDRIAQLGRGICSNIEFMLNPTDSASEPAGEGGSAGADYSNVWNPTGNPGKYHSTNNPGGADTFSVDFYFRGNNRTTARYDEMILTVRQRMAESGWDKFAICEFGTYRNVSPDSQVANRYPGACTDSELATLFEWSLKPNANGTSLADCAALGQLDFVSWWESLKTHGTAPKQCRYQLYADKDPLTWKVLAGAAYPSADQTGAVFPSNPAYLPEFP